MQGIINGRMQNIIQRIGKMEDVHRKDEIDDLNEELDQLNDVAEDMMEDRGLLPGQTETITLF